ncbi:hypothetical protein LY622_05965 [Halomonas sp. M5N1S17]|uniref:hypothetical protein n=1 Tax=Halomonas alkalisoli TaxID=2907158 RepID=UPI001F206E63|nr:hypothetical protein [Halomonas alkalisoli]MCE9662979.1 hypothetical protein [Halomonas alkalisoli]
MSKRRRQYNSNFKSYVALDAMNWLDLCHHFRGGAPARIRYQATKNPTPLSEYGVS